MICLIDDHYDDVIILILSMMMVMLDDGGVDMIMSYMHIDRTAVKYTESVDRIF